jgi:hypothetical protein
MAPLSAQRRGVVINDPFFYMNIYKAQERYQEALRDAEIERLLVESETRLPLLARVGEGLIVLGSKLKERYTQPQLMAECQSA